jgi:hypothetical protein
VGCCLGGACLAGGSDTSCGMLGVACQDCTASAQVCTGGACSAAQDSGTGPCTTKYQHDDGLDSIESTFSDCVPSTPVSSDLAQDECNHNASQCTQACPGSDGGGPTAWCGSGFFGCDCWAFAGSATGHVGEGNANCVCPTPSGPAFH